MTDPIPRLIPASSEVNIGSERRRPQGGSVSTRTAESLGTLHRAGSKADKVLQLMKRKEGATLAEIAKATDWQNHSIRGFVNGHVTKNLGLKVESTKSEAGERTYRIVT
jgi:hypothetical protein